MNEIPSRQEMFNRAWRGLKSQGFMRCTDGGVCVYDDGHGHHCAWGWVDHESWGYWGSVNRLYGEGIGVAGVLDYDDCEFARDLQMAHDDSHEPAAMEEALRWLAQHYMLTIPSEDGGL